MRGQNSLPSLFLSVFRRCFNISSKEQQIQINEEIRDKEIRVISNDGEQLGIMSASEALKLAENSNLDLVKIAPMAKPPVCKIMDYGKYRFDASKKEKDAKKRQKVAELKGMQLSMNIADNDMQFKAKNVRKFITNGDKVKVSLRMFGRQLANPQMGLPIMEKFYEMLSDVADLTSKPEINGRNIIMVLSPKNTK